jgi:hypothetical protein
MSTMPSFDLFRIGHSSMPAERFVRRRRKVRAPGAAAEKR